MISGDNSSSKDLWAVRGVEMCSGGVGVTELIAVSPGKWWWEGGMLDGWVGGVRCFSIRCGTLDGWPDTWFRVVGCDAECTVQTAITWNYLC